jgi:hypothetical protein
LSNFSLRRELFELLLLADRALRVETTEILELGRTSMLAQALQTFWAKKPCKKSPDLHPRQGDLPHWNIFTTKPLFTTKK